jgi:hypothetical protein
MEMEAAAVAAAALELDWGDWGSDAELEARLTAHELAVMRLAADPPTALDDGVGGRAAASSLLLLGTREGGEDDDDDDVTGAAARLAPARFLAPHERSRQVALVSYPRSGNSLLRSLLESCTGILTGSDGHADAPLSRDLAAFGLAAEGISDGRVWLVKSHWPERRGAAEVCVPRRPVLTTARASPPPFGMHRLTTARAPPRPSPPPRPSSPRCACMRRCSSCVARWMRSTRIGIWF